MNMTFKTWFLLSICLVVMAFKIVNKSWKNPSVDPASKVMKIKPKNLLSFSPLFCVTHGCFVKNHWEICPHRNCSPSRVSFAIFPYIHFLIFLSTAEKMPLGVCKNSPVCKVAVVNGMRRRRIWKIFFTENPCLWSKKYCRSNSDWKRHTNFFSKVSSALKTLFFSSISCFFPQTPLKNISL